MTTEQKGRYRGPEWRKDYNKANERVTISNARDSPRYRLQPRPVSNYLYGF